MTRRIVLFSIFLVGAALICAGCVTTKPDQLPRDYREHGSIKKVRPTIFPPDDLSWIKVDETTRRKVWFNDRLTLELVETSKSALTGNITPQHRYHDVVGYVIAGAAMVTVGKETKQIAAGGAFVVPSNTPYDIIPAADKTTVLYAYTPPREDLRPSAPIVRRFPDNEIKSLLYKWFALFDEKAAVGQFLGLLADRGLTMEMVDKKTIKSWKDFEAWHGAWISGIETYSSTVQDVTVTYDPATGHYTTGATVSWNMKMHGGRSGSGQYRADVIFADDSWGSVPKIVTYKESGIKK